MRRRLVLLVALSCSSAVLVSVDRTSRRIGSQLAARATAAGDFAGTNSSISVAVCGDDGVSVFVRLTGGATADAEGEEYSDGAETWSREELLTTTQGYDRILAVDLDGDGDLDLLHSGLEEMNVTWHENTGAGWRLRTLAETGRGVFSLATGDVDSDGDVDVLLTNFYDDLLGWYENSGDASQWTWHVISSTWPTRGPAACLLADIDGDGHLDAAFGSYDTKVIAWFKMLDPSAPTTTAWDFEAVSIDADGAISLVAADFDGDGYMDLASAQAFDNKIRWYRNELGDGTSWSANEVDSDALAVNAIVAADLDDDGDVDIAVAVFGNNSVVWYENDGEFIPHVIQNDLTRGASGVDLVDVDFDGDLDIVSSGATVVQPGGALGAVVWHDLHLVPAPTAAPTITFTPTGVPTGIPTSTPTSAPTALANGTFPPTSLATTPTPTTVPTQTNKGKKRQWHKRYRFELTAAALGLLALIALPIVYINILKPILDFIEPYWRPQFDFLTMRWLRSTTRKRACLFCPKRCHSEVIDPLEPPDGVELHDGGFFPVRISADPPRGAFKFKVAKEGKRTVSLY